MVDMYDHTQPRVVVIGGGSGTAAIYPEIARKTTRATAILGIFDSGGSTGKLSQELGIPAVGDIRNVMMAASENPAIREMRRHRFGEGEAFRGHPVGNLIVAACIEQYGIREGVRQAGMFLQVPGRVLPVALETAELRLQDGTRLIRGEHRIDTYHTTTATPHVSIAPAVSINPDARSAIEEADLIVIAGGSVYTSLLAVLTVAGVADALRARHGVLVQLTNLATEAHQTNGWHVANYVTLLHRYQIYPDVVLYNNERPSDEMLANYAAEGEHPVAFSPAGFKDIPDVKLIGAPLLSHAKHSTNPNDPIKRGLMRHDAQRVTNVLWGVL